MDLLLEIFKLIVAGTIGGLIASWLNWRHFRKEARFEDEIKRRDALRKILGELVPEIDSGTRADFEWWGLYKDNSKEALEKVNTLKKQIESYAPLFIGDNEVVSALFRIRNFIGTDSSYWRMLDIPPFKEYHESREILKNRLMVLDMELYE